MLLKPVLVELGATCPTRGLFLVDSDYAESQPELFSIASSGLRRGSVL